MAASGCGVLEMHIFRNLTEVREQVERRVADYNNEIPHDSLDGLAPADLRVQNDPATPNLAWYRFVGSRQVHGFTPPWSRNHGINSGPACTPTWHYGAIRW